MNIKEIIFLKHKAFLTLLKNSKKLKISIIALICFFVIQYIVNINDFRYLTIQGVDTKMNLYFEILEINPNDNICSFNLRLSYKRVLNHKSWNYPDTFEMIMFSGEVVKVNNKTLGYHNQNFFSREIHILKDFKEVPLVHFKNILEKVYDTTNSKLHADYQIKGKYYPFDTGKLNFSFVLKDKTGKNYFPNIHIKISDNDYRYSKLGQQLSTSEFNNQFSGQIVENSFQIYFSRNITKMLLFIVVILFVFLIFSLIAYKYCTVSLQNNQNIKVEDFIIVISIVLTFPDLRNYLLPNNLKFAYLYDYFSILIWFFALIIGLIVMKDNSILDKINRLIDKYK